MKAAVALLRTMPRNASAPTGTLDRERYLHDTLCARVKYLTYDYKAPTPANKKKSSSGGSQQQAAPVDLSAQFTNMNKQFRTFHKVDKPFIVYAKPKRATGWVNFRYAPNEKAERVRQVRQNEILTVIGQTDNWYQVEDPQTGIIGYISRTYVSTNPN